MKHKITKGSILVFLLIAWLFISLPVSAQKKRVSCVGNSITAGYGLSNPSQDSYPSQLLGLLGSENWDVGNFGASGRTMLKGGGYYYWDDGQYTSALNSNPDFVELGLGTNDSKDWLCNWLGESDFKKDFKAMVQSFQSLTSTPDIYVFLLVPGEKADWGIYNSYIDKVNVKISEIAIEMGLGIIDQHSAFEGHWPAWFQSDSVHPSVDGAYNIALNVKDLLLRSKPEITYVNDSVCAPNGEDFQWYIDGIAVSAVNGGRQKKMSVTQSGNYKVSLRLFPNSETRIVSKEFNVDVQNGVDSKSINNKVKIYPNPVIDTLFIDADNLPVNADYNITDLSGKVVLSGRIENGSNFINVDKLPNGTFLLLVDSTCVKFIKIN